jgi:hypothetical protein
MATASPHPIPGTDAYWHDRREAFALIRRLENAVAECKRAPLYLAGPSYDAEDNYDDVVENLGPWEYVATLRQRARDNPTVAEILATQRRLSLIE